MPVSGDQYLWSGPASGNWGVAANWADVTTGANPAPTHPTAGDFVTIPSAGRLNGVPVTQVIKGNGASATLTIGGLVSLNGTFRTGSLDIAGSAFNGSALYVSGGSLVVNRNVTVGDDGGKLDAAGGAITIGGTTTANASAENGGSVQVGGLSETGVNLSADSTSWIEIGTVGGAQAGSIQIDAGASLHQAGGGAPTVINHGTIDGGGFYATNLTNTGAISGAGFGALNAGALTVTNTGTITLIGNAIDGTVVNNSLLLANLGSTGFQNQVGAVTGTGQIRIGPGANLNTVGQVSSGQTITFTGTGGSLTIAPSSLDGAKVYDPTISGFARDDGFVFNGTVTSASYQAAGGILSLMNGGGVVAQLHLAGNYSGAAFRTVAASGATAIFIDDGADTATAPPGTAALDHYVWSSPGPGSWDSAANWTDTTTGAHPAAIAPGNNDSVTINARGRGLPQVITGTGKSASLTIAGDTVLSGTFTTKALTLSAGSLTLDTGSLLTVNGDFHGSPFISSGTLKVVGTLTGALYASDGGAIRVGAFVSTTDGSVNLDATSSAEIGGKNSATPGSLVIDAGTTVTLYQVSAPTVVNHGTINQPGQYYVFYANQVTNTGAISGESFRPFTVDSSLTVTNSATGTITLNGDTIAGALVNNGLLIASYGLDSGIGATPIDRVGDITGKGQIQIGAQGWLVTGHAGANQTITFTANTGELEVSAASLDSYHTYEARIAGFAPGDKIDYDGFANGAVYDASTGTLHLNSGAANVANFRLNGDYTGDTFHLTPVGGGGTQITVTASGMSAMAASPASMTSDSFDFTGATGSQTPTSGKSDLSNGVPGGLTGMSAQIDMAHVGTFLDPYIVAEASLMPWAHHAPSADFTL